MGPGLVVLANSVTLVTGCLKMLRFAIKLILVLALIPVTSSVTYRLVKYLKSPAPCSCNGSK